MRIITLISIVLVFLISCKTIKTDIISDEIKIVNQLLLIAKPDYDEINLLSKPNNELVETFKNGGFQDDSLNIYKEKFNYRDDRVSRWNRSMSINNKKLNGKLKILKDSYKIKSVSHTQMHKAKMFVTLSNTMFSENNTLAIISIEFFSNLEISQYYEGRIYIFKKKGDKWVYVSDFMATVS